MPQSRYSLSFDGSTGYASAPATATGSTVTLALWVKFTGPLDGGLGQPMLLQSGGWFLGVIGSSSSGTGTARLAVFDGAWDMATASDLTDGAWYHVALVGVPGSVKLYLDGVQVGSFAATMPAGGSALYLGARPDVLSAPYLLSGLLDDVAVFASALTAGQVAALAAGTLDPATLTTSGLWRFEEGSGTAAADSSGNGNDGTLSGGVTWSSDVPIQLQGITFDAASNSGNKTSVSSFTWSHTCAGSDRFLAVDVTFGDLGTPTVTGITYNSVAMTFLVAKSIAIGSVTVRVESWGLANPASGSNTVAVTLSGTAAVSLGMAVSYTDVNQTVPTEAISSASGVDAGAGVATVTVTTVADNDWVHAAIVDYGDIAITADQTSRSNVPAPGSGTGADEDTGPVTPAGVQAMTYSDIAITTSWAMVGYAIRSVLAVNFSFTRPFFVFQAVNAAATY